jgi:epoxyqueuosine reductase
MNLNAPTTADPKAPLISYDVVRRLSVYSGFSEAGIVALPHVHEHRDAERFLSWIDAGRAGTMQYLKRENEEGQLVCARVATPFPWARSAIVCLANYNSAQPKSTDPAPRDAAWIARYAWSGRSDERGRRVPSDYHKVLLKRLHAIEAGLHEEYGRFESRAHVDTGPIIERALATAAGLGWIAKNTCLIHPRIGSYVFLAVLLTSLEVEPERAPLAGADRCGSCTRCIEACPTDALFTPYQMDATRCISYLTIEHRGAIAPELMERMGRQVFGCDICQDVCPWNRSSRSPLSADPGLAAREELVNPALEWLASLDEHEWQQTFNGSPVRRARFAGFQRNVAVAMGNSGARRFAERLREWAEAADTGLRTAARWALERLEE